MAKFPAYPSGYPDNPDVPSPARPFPKIACWRAFQPDYLTSARPLRCQASNLPKGGSMLSKQSLFSKREEAPAPRNPWPGNAAPASPSAVAASSATPAKAAPPAASAPATDQPSGSRLIVGPDVKLKGAEIQDCDTLVVEGRVEATLDSRLLRIAEQGSFSGKVGIDVAEIHGHFEGELVARKQLLIHATGRVSGNIRYGSILIDEGGQVSGDVRALGPEDLLPLTPSTPSGSAREPGQVQEGRALSSAPSSA